MKIYTKTGDRGDTGLFGGGRVPKHDPRVAAYGDVDELNSTLGWARSLGLPDEVDAVLQVVQSELFELGAELATMPEKRHKLPSQGIEQEQIASLEQAIDRADEKLPPLSTFILPGGSPGAAALHIARCVCRRAERQVVGVAASQEVRPALVRYLNRLSDLLFTLARLCNHCAAQPDIPWVSRRNG